MHGQSTESIKQALENRGKNGGAEVSIGRTFRDFEISFSLCI
jgi:hypothetical protein